MADNGSDSERPPAFSEVGSVPVGTFDPEEIPPRSDETSALSTIASDCERWKSVGKYLVSEIAAIDVSPDDSRYCQLLVPVPFIARNSAHAVHGEYGTCLVSEHLLPYVWHPEMTEIVSLAEANGYGQTDWEALERTPVLLFYNEYTDEWEVQSDISVEDYRGTRQRWRPVLGRRLRTASAKLLRVGRGFWNALTVGGALLVGLLLFAFGLPVLGFDTVFTVLAVLVCILFVATSLLLFSRTSE